MYVYTHRHTLSFKKSNGNSNHLDICKFLLHHYKIQNENQTFTISSALGNSSYYLAENSWTCYVQLRHPILQPLLKLIAFIHVGNPTGVNGSTCVSDCADTRKNNPLKLGLRAVRQHQGLLSTHTHKYKLKLLLTECIQYMLLNQSAIYLEITGKSMTKCDSKGVCRD